MVPALVVWGLCEPALGARLAPWAPGAVPWLLGAALALALRFGRTRAVWTLALIVLTWLLAREGSAAGTPLLLVCSVAAPAAVLATLLARPASVVSLRGALRAVVGGAAAWGLVMLAESQGEAVSASLSAASLSAAPALWHGLPQAAWMMHGAALVTAAVVAWRRRSGLDVAFVPAVAALAAMFALAGDAAAVALVACGAGALMLLATLEASFDLAFRDRLTGLPGRRALEELLEQQGHRYAVAMVDVDHFKKFNDRYGHDAGDRVLQAVARRLAAVRGGGRAFRYGGEEFTIVFPRRDVEHAGQHLEDVRKAIKDTRVPLPRKAGKATKERRVSVTVSIGVAQRSDALPAPDAVVKEADRALYRAKKAGRNRVELAG